MRFSWVAVLSLALLGAGSLARADELPKGCFPSIKEAAADLSKRFEESVRGVGWSDRQKGYVAVFAGPTTWTLVKIEADGSACYVDGGESWRDAPTGDPS